MNVNFNPYTTKPLPRGEQLKREAHITAKHYAHMAKRDPDADETEWFVAEILKAIADGRIGWLS